MQGMETENTKQTRKGRRLSLPMHGTNLKLYGCVTMVFYTLSVSVIQNGMIHIGQYASSEEFSEALAADPDLMLLSSWASIFQMIGWLSVPVFAFLLVEGFRHTSSFKRYLLTMLGFAVVSEVPYDLAISGSLWDLSSQNPLFTLSICLIMLYGLRLYSERKGVAVRVTQGIVILAAVLWCTMLGSAFGLCTVLLTATYYLVTQRKGMRVLLGCAISAMYVTAPLSGFALWHYTGKRGWNKNKYLFYAFYPLHLLACAGAARLLSA